MKKWIIGFLILIILLIVSINIFIPAKLKISSIAIAGCTQSGAYRILSDTSKWQTWWPQFEKRLTYKGSSFTVSEILNNTFKLKIADNNLSMMSILNLLPVARDSVAIEWSGQIAASSNPWKRFTTYLAAVRTKKKMDAIINTLKQFLQKPENIYGIKITESSTTDTLLLCTKMVFPHYPSTSEIYKLVDELKHEIVTKGSFITGNPMINITPLTSNQIEFMAAVPINKVFETEAVFFFRRMIPGNFLTSTVRGGEFTVTNAQQQMEFFLSDYQKTSMAISFQSLITDRSIESDTSKWLTKLYEPVMK